MSQRNYITPKGAETLQSELRHLRHEERPKLVEVIAWAASNGDRSENADYQYGKRRLREIDRRVSFLTSRLEIAEVIDPKKQTSDKILFGATVTIQNEEGDIKRYQIVGMDEIDVKNGKISWKSPLASKLLGKRALDVIYFQDQELEILKIEYV